VSGVASSETTVVASFASTKAVQVSLKVLLQLIAILAAAAGPLLLLAQAFDVVVELLENLRVVATLVRERPWRRFRKRPDEIGRLGMNRAGKRGAELPQALEPTAVIAFNLSGYRPGDLVRGRDWECVLRRQMDHTRERLSPATIALQTGLRPLYGRPFGALQAAQCRRAGTAPGARGGAKLPDGVSSRGDGNRREQSSG